MVCAIPAELEAIPPKPSRPANNEKIKNINAHLNITTAFGVDRTFLTARVVKVGVLGFKGACSSCVLIYTN